MSRDNLQAMEQLSAAANQGHARAREALREMRLSAWRWGRMNPAEDLWGCAPDHVCSPPRRATRAARAPAGRRGRQASATFLTAAAPGGGRYTRAEVRGFAKKDGGRGHWRAVDVGAQPGMRAAHGRSVGEAV